MIVIVNTDGGSRGNPGQAAIGVVFSDSTNVLAELKKAIGVATNNEAEYQAVLNSLEWLITNPLHLKPTKIIWKLDSKLVVEQLSKKWKIKEPRMQELAKKCWAQLQLLNCSFEFKHVPREENKEADALVNQALDALA